MIPFLFRIQRKTINNTQFFNSGVLSTFPTSYPQSATYKKGSAPGNLTRSHGESLCKRQMTDYIKIIFSFPG